jgi:CRP/FNR family transcriptional regulator
MASIKTNNPGQCDLKRCFLCRHSLKGWLLSVAAHKKNIRFTKGASIFEEGNKVEGIYFVYSGKVKVHRQWGKGKDLIVHFAKEGDMIGYRGLGKEKIYPVSATALTPVLACYIDLDFFESSLEVNHRLTYRFMQFFANELQEAEKRMNQLAHLHVKGRVANTILLLQQFFGTQKDGFIDIVLTRQDIASYAGTTYETVFRILNELVKKKFIKISGKRIAILKENALEILTRSSEEE